MSHYSLFLRSREIYSRSGSETSPTGFPYPDIHSRRVSHHLEASFFRDKLSRVSSIQEGATPLANSVFGGVGISSSA